MGDEPVGQDALLLHHPDPAPEPARPRHHVVAQLVAVADHRQMHREVLERIVAGVGHQIVDAVGAVRGGAPAVGALVDLQEHPVLAVRLEPGVGGEGEGRGAAGDDVVRQHRRERLVGEVDDAVDLGEPRFRRGREVGVVDGALRGDHADGAERSLVRGHLDLARLRIEQQRADGAEAGDLGGALERHVEAGLDLVRGPGEIDLDAVALHPHADLDGQAHVAVSAVVVEEALGAVLAVGDLGDALAQHPLGVVHELMRVAVSTVSIP